MIIYTSTYNVDTRLDLMGGPRCAYCGFDLNRSSQNKPLAEGKPRIRVVVGFWFYRGEYTEAPRGESVLPNKFGWLLSSGGSRARILFKRRMEVEGCSHFSWDVVENVPLVLVDLENRG